MKPLIKSALLFILLISIGPVSSAQFLVSSYKPKNKTEKFILAKVLALPEIKWHLKTNKGEHPDLVFNLPDSLNEYYSVQVGIGDDMFRTSYYLYIDPKTLAIYYNDFFDESGSKWITLKQWRYWRGKPEFEYDVHTWKHGKLIVVKTKK